MNEFSYEERHLGTTVSLSFICINKAQADTWAKACFDTIHQYEQCFSRFLPESELSILNSAGTATVSEIFLNVLMRSLELTELTKGGFNPLVQVATLGYQTNFTELSDTALVDTNVYNTEVHTIQIDTHHHAVTLQPHQKLDFGGMLKGYLAANLADSITGKNPDCYGCIINIGGDLATRGTDALHQPFIFLLYNPITGAETPITVTDASLATSGTYARQWHTTTGKRHHIVDGRTRDNPDNTIVAVSIVTNDGAESEALTKLFLNQGVTKGVAMVAPHDYHYSFFVVYADGSVDTSFL
jgi:FAD:protein FMN transferase